MIHCYATQEVTAKPEPQSQRAQSYYHMATTNGQPQQQQDHRQHHPQQQQQQQHHHHHHQQQQPQLVECCPVCNHQLPCSCTGYHKAASNDFYATSNQQQQQQQQQSDPSRASLTSNRQAATSGHHIQQQSHQTSPNHQSATNGSGGSHHHNQHHHHHQHGASLTQISPSAGADNNNDNLLIEPQCSAKTTEHPAGQTADSKQTAQQTDELYGRLYDIEPKRAQPQQHPQQSAWGEHFQFPLSPAASLRPQDSDYLHHDINRDLATSSVSPSGSRLQEGAQAYRRPTSAESAKQQSCPLNDFNNNNNNRPVQDGAADDQQASASLSFAPLMPIIETSSLEHMQTDQRDTTNEQDFYHQHHYNSSTADYLSCFGDNNNTGQQREQVAVESVEKGDKLADDEHHHRYTNDMSNHHQPLGRIGANLASHHYGRHQHQQQHSHQQQQQQHQQEHSPSSSTSSACSNLAAGNSIVTEQSNEFYSHHQYQSQTQPQYSQAMGMEQNQYNGELTSPTHTTTPGCGQQQQQQQQQQVALFQDYYNYTTCDPNATATSQPARQPQQQPQQYHGQQDVSSYQDNYSQLQEAQFRGVTEQDGRATTISYEAPKTALYQQVPVDTISSVGGQLMLISPQDVPTVDYNQQASATTNTTVSVESQPTSGANANQSAIRATSKTTPGSTKPPLSRTRRGRPRKKSGHSKGKVSGKLWEFIRDLLLSERTNPSFIRWERREDGVFKFVQSDKVAKMWGERKQNPKMTYEKLSRAMRYYYKSKVLLPVFGRRLVYKFGPNATGWMCPSSSAESSPSHSAHSHHNNSIQTQDLDIEHNHQTHHHLLHSYQPHPHDHHHHHISPQHHHSAHNNHQDLLDHRAASLAAHGANFSQDAIIY